MCGHASVEERSLDLIVNASQLEPGASAEGDEKESEIITEMTCKNERNWKLKIFNQDDFVSVVTTVVTVFQYICKDGLSQRSKVNFTIKIREQ